jgi:urease accessory protein
MQSSADGALLLLLLDSRAPAGAHNHSGGMEPAITAGLVRELADVEEFCRGRLRTSGRVAAAFAAAACHLWLGPAASFPTVSRPPGGASVGTADEWAELEAEYQARTLSEAARAASRQLGGGLRRLLRSMFPDVDLVAPWSGCAPPAPHHPLVLGAGVALAGGSPELAARAAALATCNSGASAAVRLLGLDPFAVYGLLARLGPEIDALAADCAAAAGGSPRSLPADGAPALDLLADFHLTSEVRLFAS